MWTQFMDMHSGGGQKLDWAYIYIEAPEFEAVRIFYAKFGRNPHRVTCTCCGSDYSLTESTTLELATAYNRNCRYARPLSSKEFFKASKEEREHSNRVGRYFEADEEIPDGWEVSPHYREPSSISLDKYLTNSEILVIYADQILDSERNGPSPNPEGYVWV